LLAGGFPVSRQELVEPSVGMIGDAGQDVGEPGLGVDVVELGGADERGMSQRCRTLAPAWCRRFPGSLRVVTEWMTLRRCDEAAVAEGMPWKCPSARAIARMMTTHRDNSTIRQAIMMTMIEKAVPDLVGARDLLDEFHAIVRERKRDCLDSWIARAKTGLLASFATGLAADRAAVEAALSEPWSSGQVEGQITRLKLLKRQMYGRAKVDLLEARLLCAA
jgi:Transposase